MYSEGIILSLNLKNAFELISYDELSVAVVYDLIHDSDISLRRWIYSMYEEVIFISVDKRSYPYMP